MENFIDGYEVVTEENVSFTTDMHSHEYYEIYCFLSGNAQYCVEGRRYDLAPGDILLLTKGEIHRVELHSQERYHRIGVHFNLHNVSSDIDLGYLLSPFHNRPIGKFNHYPARLFANEIWIHYLHQIVHPNNAAVSVCYLLPLLCELANAFSILQQAEIYAEKDSAAPIMKYINRNLSQKLSLEILSQKFYISQTHLNRLFRKSVGTTVWEYITIKRLFMAQDLLSKGYTPYEIYSTCGFQEYSTFYRAYKRHFGVSPSKHK